MNRYLLAVGVAVIVACTVAFSRKATEGQAESPFRIASEAKNPWTTLKQPADQFQFAIVSDRTGGHRANIFARAVQQLNLMQPEFVMSVGDLIEGYTTKVEELNREWDEFDALVRKLEMPFFYVPGNHDMANKTMAEYWGGRYGRAYFSFVYKNVLFLNLNSGDNKSATLSPEQIADAKKILDDHRNVRWTLVFVHIPVWERPNVEVTGWLEVEKALAGRNYTVFCGHEHQYQKYIRNGMNYYQLATTGGGSKLRGVEYGEFDHITWVTMKADGPRLANILMDGILPENLQPPPVSEPGVKVKMQPLVAVNGTLTVSGQPAAGVHVMFEQMEAPKGFNKAYPDAYTDANGRFTLSTYTKYDGAPAGKYRVALVLTGKPPTDGDANRTKSLLPEQYAKISTSPLVVEIKPTGPNEPMIAITK